MTSKAQQELLLEMPQHYIAGGVYAKELHLLSIGAKVTQHVHKYDHLSLLATGRVAVTTPEGRKEYSAPTGVLIKAGVAHEIEALTADVLWYCVHSVPQDLRGEALIDASLIEDAA